MNPGGDSTRPEVRQPSANTLRLRSLGIDTHQDPVLFMRADCSVCRSVGFTVQSRVRVTFASRHVIATIAMVHGDLLADGEAALSETALRALHAHAGDRISVSHAPDVGSLSDLRASGAAPSRSVRRTMCGSASSARSISTGKDSWWRGCCPRKWRPGPRTC